MNPYSPPSNFRADLAPTVSGEHPSLSGYIREFAGCTAGILIPPILAGTIAYLPCMALASIGLHTIAIGVFAVVTYSTLGYRLFSRDYSGNRRGFRFLQLLLNPPFTPNRIHIILSIPISVMAMAVASAYILHDHNTRPQSPDGFSDLDIPLLILLCVFYVLLCFCPAVYLWRRGAPNLRRISLALLWLPVVVVGLSFASLLF